MRVTKSCNIAVCSGDRSLQAINFSTVSKARSHYSSVAIALG
ncbi:MAG: hypothetical protein RMY29_023595 [Nostoc sp. CreGUA01]|nr:hypothetical protein [Nostoc sp. CreGUA01]